MPDVREAPSSSPIELLPPELISTILLTATQSAPNSKTTALTDSAQLVCRLWREIALHTPALWSTLYIGDTYRMAEIVAGLERSKDSPLSIELNTTSKLQNPEILMGALVPHTHRWKSLDARLQEDDMNTITKLMPAVLPALTSLSLQRHFDPMGRSVLNFNMECPSLRHLTVTGVSINQENCANIPRIRHLAINKFGSPWMIQPSRRVFINLSAVLAQCKELTYLDFTSFPMSTRKVNGADHLVIPNLLRLKMCFLSLDPQLSLYSQVLTAYTFPNLTHLHIAGKGFTPLVEEDQEDICIPSLTHLEVEYLMDLDHLVSHLLTFSPNIVFIRMISADNRIFWLSSTSPFRSPSMCPRLTTLETQGLTIDALYDIVNSRKGILQNLTTHIEDVTVTRYEECQEQTLHEKLFKLKQWTAFSTFVWCSKWEKSLCTSSTTFMFSARSNRIGNQREPNFVLATLMSSAGGPMPPNGCCPPIPRYTFPHHFWHSRGCRASQHHVLCGPSSLQRQRRHY